MSKIHPKRSVLCLEKGSCEIQCTASQPYLIKVDRQPSSALGSGGGPSLMRQVTLSYEIKGKKRHRIDLA